MGDGLNPYSYAHGNPLALADPMGLCAAASTLGYYVAGAIAAAAGVAAAPWVAAAFAAAALMAATDTLSTELANWMNPGSDISSEGSEAIQEAFGCSKDTADSTYEYFQAFLGGGASSGLGGGGADGGGGGGGGGSTSASAPRMTTKESELKHIFQKGVGHVPARMESSKKRFGRAFEKVAANELNRRRDLPKSAQGHRSGVEWFTQVTKRGKQLWVRVSNGFITDAGVNLPGAHR